MSVALVSFRIFQAILLSLRELWLGLGWRGSASVNPRLAVPGGRNNCCNLDPATLLSVSVHTIYSFLGWGRAGEWFLG